MTELLGKWDNFYVIVGSAAGALIGLQFVVLTLIAERPSTGTAEAGAAFASPTIVHFYHCVVVVGALQVPWQTINVIAILWSLTGLCGAIYTLLVVRRMQKQSAYKPMFEDWMFHVLLPLIAYVGLALTFFATPGHTTEALFGVGGAALLLLCIGIHNAWDNVSYHVLVVRAGRHKGKNE
ncbi:MAG TPA: hypothetical protein VGF44_05565 [Terriglobales bacterium]